MNRVLPRYRLLLLLPLVALGLLFGASVAGAQIKDSIEVVAYSGGAPYLCCYDLLITNRHDTTIKISEVRLRIISGRARFIPGQASAPNFWALFQDSAKVIWSSNAASADIRSGQTLGGFHICPRDTGVFKMVWETRNIDSVISSDTLTFACRGIDCDQAFFRPIPSSLSCTFDIDVSSGNHQGRGVNELRLHPITPGVTLKTATTRQPPGWIRIKAQPDTIVWYSQNSQLNYDQFAQGFRVEINAPADSVFQIEYWTTNFGDVLCRDTVTLRCGLTAGDSIRLTKSADSCCQNLRLKNSHLPTSPIQLFTLKVQTAGVKISSGPVLPPGWTRRILTPTGDSIAFARSGTALAYNDTALFRSLCFDNGAATSDTIRYRWRTFFSDVAVDEGIATNICLRPLTRCDSVAIRVDSTYPAAERCVYLFLKNQNSRDAVISQFVARFSNPGTARRVRSATAPAGWVVLSQSNDSVVFSNGQLLPRDTISPFTICLSNGDAATRDPLHLVWSTGNGLGAICTGSLDVNAIISSDCDSVQTQELASSDSTLCCFGVKFLNRNGKNKTLSRFELQVALPVIFASASAPSPWTVKAVSFPSFDVAFEGSTLAPDSATPQFNICLDMRQVANRPATIPAVWRTFDGGVLVCVDTVRLVCTGSGGEVRCDSFRIAPGDISFAENFYKAFSLRNLHTPDGPIDGARFTLIGDGAFSGGEGRGTASGFTSVDLKNKVVTFRGATITSGASVDSFMVQFGAFPVDRTLMVEACALDGDRVVCCSTFTVSYEPSGGVDDRARRHGIILSDARPNPTTGRIEIPYELAYRSKVTVVVSDNGGGELRRVERGMEEPGMYSVVIDLGELPSGLYNYSVEVEGGRVTRWLVVVR